MPGGPLRRWNKTEHRKKILCSRRLRPLATGSPAAPACVVIARHNVPSGLVEKERLALLDREKLSGDC